jgi:hypothetical protein
LKRFFTLSPNWRRVAATVKAKKSGQAVWLPEEAASSDNPTKISEIFLAMVEKFVEKEASKWK